MATGNTSNFFTNGTPEQFERVMDLYPQVLRLKAESKNKKPEELLKLDNWYQNELPKKLKARGKDAHLNHEELVQLMKWKQTRGKFYPQLNYLVKVNTPRAVMLETKKAFKKLPNLELALSALSNLKGVGTTLASALLAAATPEVAPFMADECLMAIPEIEGIDYTTKEYLKFVNFINNTVERLNKESTNGEGSWSAHQVELALWTHYVASELKPELLEDIQVSGGNTNGNATHVNGSNPTLDTCSDESNLEPAVRSEKPVLTATSEPEDTSSLQSLPSEKSLDSIDNNHTDDITNDSVMTESSSDIPASGGDSNPPPPVQPVEADDNASAEPPLKKTKREPTPPPEEIVEKVNNGHTSEDSVPTAPSETSPLKENEKVTDSDKADDAEKIDDSTTTEKDETAPTTEKSEEVPSAEESKTE